MCGHDTKSRLTRPREAKAGAAAKRISACRTAKNARWQPLSWFLLMAGTGRGHHIMRGASAAQPENFETLVVDGVPQVCSQVVSLLETQGSEGTKC